MLRELIFLIAVNSNRLTVVVKYVMFSKTHELRIYRKFTIQIQEERKHEKACSDQTRRK